jgi:ribosomal 50S subunit-associated protein YjgA (DUF615 family)
MDRIELRNRLRDVNIKHSALLKSKLSEGRFVRLAQLRNERATLMCLLAGDGTLRVVISEMPNADRQPA